MGTDAHPNGVAAELEKILSSQSFANSSQGSRLLRFVVQRTLEGRADEIKESVLGVEVFGRPSFDPRTDPIARVEASRLRQKLARYYESEGKQDAVRIVLPKGGYVPVFEPIAEPTASPLVRSGPRREQMAWAVAGLFAAIALALGLGYLRRTAPDVETRKLSLLPPPQASFVGQPANVSPDGRLLAFVAAAGSQTPLLWIRPLNSLNAWALIGTEGATYPFWSPDSRNLGFFSGGKLKRVDVAGGAVQTICDAPVGRGGTWNQQGVIVFAPNVRTPLYRVPASGGSPVAETELDSRSLEAGHRWPQFLPGGAHLVYTVRFHRQDRAIYLGKLGSRDRIRMASVDSNTAFVQLGRKTGCLLFCSEGSVLGQRIDTSRFRIIGDAFPVAGPVGFSMEGRADFGVSENGVLAYSSAGGGATEQLIWRDRGGKPLGSLNVPGALYQRPSLSPDEHMVVVNSSPMENPSLSLWLFDLSRRAASRFTFGPDGAPVWSPDGKQIAYSSDRTGHYDLFVKPSSGAEGERLLLQSGRNKFPSSWSPDGKSLLFDEEESGTKRDIWMLPLTGDAKPVPILQTPADEYVARFSPDGRWIAYTSDESGREEVYIQSFPPNGNKRQISRRGGSWPEWRRDGKELFFISADRQVMAAALADPNTLTFATPEALFPASRGRISGLTVTPNGQRFLMSLLNEEGPSSPVTVVLNWTAGIR